MGINRVRNGLLKLETIFEGVYLKVNVDFSVPCLAIVEYSTARDSL